MNILLIIKRNYSNFCNKLSSPRINNRIVNNFSKNQKLKTMLKSKLIVGLFALMLAAGLTGCCCCEDDDPQPGCPDLIVKEIDLGTLNVSCPGGFGTCVTTVDYTIQNTGTADAGPFNIRIMMDPGVVLNEFVPGGLAAGASLTFTAVSPPGGNCFDPDCTIKVFVDSANDVDECDENNNEESVFMLG